MVTWLSAAGVFAKGADSLSLLFIGDLMQHQAQLDAARMPDGSYDYTDCFRWVSPEFAKADLVIGNLEVPLGGKPYTGYPAFSAPDSYLKSLRQAGVDVLLTANNHCLDRGKMGLERTICLLDSFRVPHVGTYRTRQERLDFYPLLVEQKGFRVVFLNYTYGTNGLRPVTPNVVNYIDREQMRRDILKARLMKPDVLIACMHWGVEYQSLPRSEERALADWLLKMGVDHVIGAHPHVIQPVEVREDSLSPTRHLIAYSLGNFVSNMSAPQTDGGMAVKLLLRRVEGKTRLVDCAYALVWTSRPVLSGKKNFQVYPAGMDENKMHMSEKQRMKAYLEGARKLQEKHGKGVREYFFE